MLHIARKFRFAARFLSAYFRRYRLKALGLFLLLVVSSFLLYRLTPEILSGKNVYSEGIVGVYSGQNLPERITSLVSSGLTKIGMDGQITGALAENWEILEEGKIYRFHLNNNLYWQNGEKFKIRDANLQIDGVEISYPDDKTVEFKLSEPFAPFPALLSKPIFKKRSLIGTNSYTIKAIKRKNETVHEIVLHSKAQEKTKMTFKIYPTTTQAILAFKQGEVHAISQINQINSLSTWPNVGFDKRIDNNSVVVIFLNTKKEIFSKKEIRQAVSKALRAEKLPGQVTASSISGTSWAFNRELKGYEFADEKAIKTIQEANLQNKQVLLAYLPSYQKLAENIAQDWRSLGLEVNLKQVNSVPQEFDAFLAGQEIPKDPDQYSLWHSTQNVTNITKIASPRIDKLLEDGRRIVDQKTRKEKYFEFQRAMSDEVPAIFLYYPEQYYIYWEKAKEEIDRLSNASVCFPRPCQLN